MRIKKARHYYHAKLIAIYLTAAAVLAVGSAIVTVNCHNAMYSDQISLFSINKEDGRTVITVMGRVISGECSSEDQP